MGIDKFFAKKGRSRVKMFEKISKEKNKKRRRILEEQFLKPYVLPDYKGPLPGHKSSVESRKVLMIFENDSDIILLKKFFKVSEYKGYNVKDLSLLLKFLDALDDGSLVYDKKAKKINFVGEDGEHIPL